MQVDPSMMQAQQAQQPQAAMAGMHFFDASNYKEVTQVLIEYTGFIFAEVQKEPLTHEKLGRMLNLFMQNCLRQGMSPQEQPIAEGTCTHIYTRSKGENNGKVCGKPAKFIGVDGQKKCSSHKASKPAKVAAGAPVASGASGQVFSYAANANKGKVAPQALTTIQASIAKQTQPATLDLVQEPGPPNGNGRVYNQATGMVVEQQNGQWVVVGVIDGPNTAKLSVNDVGVCYGNSWQWDPKAVDDEAAKALGHPLVIGGDHPLVSTPESNNLISNKISSIMNNNQ